MSILVHRHIDLVNNIFNCYSNIIWGMAQAKLYDIDNAPEESGITEISHMNMKLIIGIMHIDCPGHLTISKIWLQVQLKWTVPS